MNVRFEITIDGLVRGANATELLPDERFGELLDAVMEQLLDLNVSDPAVSGSAADGSIEVSLVVESPSDSDAIEHGAVVVRTALHGAEVRTPDWPVRFYVGTESKAELVGA